MFLQDGPKEMDTLLELLDTTRHSLLPQTKILKEHHLIFQHDDTYELTKLGKLIVEKMVPLLNNTELFDEDIDYWGTHDFGFIPPHLLERINELGNCQIIEPCLNELYELNNKFQQEIIRSDSFHLITQITHHNFPELFAEMIENNVEIYDIISQDLFDSLLANRYTDFKKIIENELVHIYVHPMDIDFMYIGYNDHNLMLSLLTINGEFDNKYLLCEGSGTLQWGKEVFDYYLENSTPITEL
nr:winged helix-turn-helix domain-containing protein [Methanolobus bombayensis]